MIKIIFLFFLILRVFLEDCSNFNNDPNWRENYQDMSYLVGYAQLQYSSDRKIYTINFFAKINPNINNYKIFYKFGDREQESNSFTITSRKSYSNGFPISARLQINGQDAAKLEFEDEYFLWDNPTINQGFQHENGQK